MKLRFFLYFALSAFLHFSCASNEEGNNKNTVLKDSLEIDSSTFMVEIDSADTVALGIDTVKIDIPMLQGIMDAKSKPALLSQFNSYLNALQIPSIIMEEKDIKRVISMRDSLISRLQYGFLEEYYYKELADKEDKQIELGKELEKIGIKPVYAEGMYAGLTESPILTDKIEELASEEFKIYIAFQQASANSLGTEYTYVDLKPEVEMVILAEKLRKDFPKSEYIKLTEDVYLDAISPLTNVHASEHEGITTYIVGGMQADVYPGWTEISNHKYFVEKYPKSKLVPIVDSIMSNISTINSEEDTIFTIVTDFVDTYSQARKMASDYILAGKDIPHFSEIKTPNGKKIALIYRFYSNSEKAKSQLEKAKKLHSQAKIVKISAEDYKQFE